MIYFARLESGAIKIGTTVHFPARMKLHKSVVAVLGVHDGGSDVEKAVHQRFDRLRLKRNGHGRHPEHFRPGPELLDYIAENCRQPDLLDQLHETQPGERSVRLYLPIEDHRRLRRLAADNDTNMALLTRKIVMEYIAKHPLKGEGRS
jgi:hypothetical protein